MDIRELLRENIRTLAPYSTARDEYQGELGIYLDANENPYDNNYNRYPDPHQKNLKRRLAEIKGVPVEKIFIGNGSDEPIDLVFRLFCEPRRHNAVSIAPTYGMYKVAAAINDVQMREVQLEPGFTLDAEKLLAAADENTRLLFLCSPNNPSGNCFPKKEIEKVIRRFNGIVILDEAYIDFAGQPGFLSELDEYPNLVILQTLSKAWGMAGLRLGLAFAQPLIVDTLSRVKYPYNINVVTQKIVLEQLRRSPDAQIAEIVSERGRVLEGLAKNPVIRKIHPTDANFVLVEVDEPRTIYDRLIGAGIIVRDRSRIKGCEGCLRITIGTPEENDRLLETLKKL
jgi:histidinol-phosphate aminotransferase